ncbi:hypothetical protein RSOLAG1IB_04839 [Rhizoctonia solani AG-1 IB]|uniref:Uncharacterized protein n=1 Tax=Thanatephorus cucumeris (strain AG1-IB / isolate 7/3/14) TaxID=1108050 RepID=A0A0B7G1V9_THACB|nr:hypothetical protein RSOLAG1IB_04839 [Rhizoctonia solani AG-1 IB]
MEAEVWPLRGATGSGRLGDLAPAEDRTARVAIALGGEGERGAPRGSRQGRGRGEGHGTCVIAGISDISSGARSHTRRPHTFDIPHSKRQASVHYSVCTVFSLWIYTGLGCGVISGSMSNVRCNFGRSAIMATTFNISFVNVE